MLIIFASKFRHVGLRIGYFRRSKKLTQVQLAEKVGISSTYLSRIERGLCAGTPLEIYWKIAEELGVTFEDLERKD